MTAGKLLRGPSIARNFSMPKALYDALKERARQEDRPVSRVVRRALILYLTDTMSSADGKNEKAPD